MRLSIRIKLFLFMVAGITVFAGLLYFANSVFLKTYTISQKKQSLILNTRKVLDLIADKASEANFHEEYLISGLHNLEKSLGMAIYIGKPDGTIFYPPPPGTYRPPDSSIDESSFIIKGRKPAPERHGSPREGIIQWSSITNETSFTITKDPFVRIDTLRYQVRLKSGLMLLLWVPIAEISRYAAISNSFTGLIALITIILTAFWALYVSGKFTRPILQMNQITHRMALLDFKQALNVKQNDELGQLSESINRLSSKLGAAIEELNLKNKKLEKDIDQERKLDKLRREFVSSVSHELKTPIFLIQGYAEGLKANVAGTIEKRDFYCNIIMEEADKMDRIIRDLLDLSQIESGVFTVNKTRFNIMEFVREALEKYSSLLRDKNILLEMRLQDQVMVNADPLRTGQVIQNYMNNAIDHTNPGRAIRIEVSVWDAKVKLSVFNTGNPIPEDSLNKIWESFYKVDSVRTREYGGSGLGLSIVKAIQERSGNRYGVINHPDGAEFWFETDLAE